MGDEEEEKLILQYDLNDRKSFLLRWWWLLVALLGCRKTSRSISVLCCLLASMVS